LSAQDKDLLERGTSNPMVMTLLAAAIVVILYYLLRATIFKIFRRILKFMGCCLRKEENKIHFKAYSEEYEGMRQRMLSTYNILDNENYTALIKSIE
jgi:hypothetical protein